MTDISKLCMVCLGEKNENGICPNCRKDTDIVQVSPLLPIKTLVSQRYLIAKAQKHNCEGITYSAYDLRLNKPVSIREFFPEQLAIRDADEISVIAKNGNEAVYTQYLNSFISLWTKIMRLKGLTALVSVTEVFQANGSAYAVYDESERITLRDYLLETAEGYIPWEKARIIFMPVLSTLGTLHTSGVIHKGINPSSFIFSKEGKLKLTDFCIEPARTVSGALDAEFFDGYTPLEQHTLNGKIGAWSDIYAFCSILYRALIGTTPIDAKARAINDQMMIPAKFAEQLPPYVINALINGMAIESTERTDNIEQLRSDLSASPRVIGASAKLYNESAQKPAAPAPKPVTPAAPPAAKAKAAPVSQETVKAQQYIKKQESKKKNTLIAVLCVILVGLLIGIGILASELIDTNNPNPSDETTTQASAIVSVPNFVGGHISDIITNEQYTAYFKFQTVEEHSATDMAGMVIAQSIPYQSQASAGDTIILTVSKGPKTFALTDVTGWTYEQAEETFSSQGLICKQSAIHNDGTHEGGTIAETIPPKDSVVKEGDTITIVIYTSLEEASTQDSSNAGNSVEQFLESLGTTAPSLQ
ncbi:MAG: PASTA domain-containing protein [Clostridia bacterium]|nr:PASTA domain-containing protein [Clostridia bacterium]